MRTNRNRRQQQGQSMVELALVLPLLVLIFVGMVEIVFAARTYLVLLEASREGARVGARGSADFDNDEIRTLVEQDLSREGYTTSNGLAEIIIVRANVGPNQVVNSYEMEKMLGSGRPTQITQSVLLSRLRPGDPRSRLVAVEIYYDHQPLVNFPVLSDIFPDPLTLHTYSIMRLLR
jgi:hypothetical protein